MAQYEWVHFKGEDADGDKFNMWAYIDGSSRIFAKVYCPRIPSEIGYRIVFLLGQEFDQDDYQFLELHPAKQLAEETVSGAVGR